MKTHAELMKRRYELRRELKQLDQDICGIETGHKNLRVYVEWDSNGKECVDCHKRFMELCHYTGPCDCPGPHRAEK